MDRIQAAERVKNYNQKDLLKWREHVVFCKRIYEKDRNQFEIEECDFLLKLIDQQLDKRRK